MTSELPLYVAHVMAWWLTYTSSHCPWVNNCVGANNHRHFLIYILTMEMGVISWGFLIYKCADIDPFEWSLS